MDYRERQRDKETNVETREGQQDTNGEKQRERLSLAELTVETDSETRNRQSDGQRDIEGLSLAELTVETETVRQETDKKRRTKRDKQRDSRLQS